MNFNGKCIAMMDDRSLVQCLSIFLSDRCDDYAEVKKRYEESVSIMKKQISADMHGHIDSFISAYMCQIASDMVFAYMLGFRFNLEHFIEENNLPVNISWFLAGNAEAAEKDIEEDDEYDEDDEDELTEEEYERQFTLLDESDKMFGASVQDLIATFGICLLKQQKVCGIDTRNIYYKVKDAVVDYLTTHVCDWEDPDGLEVTFLTDANVLNRTGIKVKNVRASELEKRLNRK